MSWTAFANEPVRRYQLTDVLTAAFQPQQGYGEEESKRDFQAALEVTAELALCLTLDGGLDEELKLTANLNGHANPGRVPEGSWSPDFIAVRVGVSPS